MPSPSKIDNIAFSMRETQKSIRLDNHFTDCSGKHIAMLLDGFQNGQIGQQGQKSKKGQKGQYGQYGKAL